MAKPVSTQKRRKKSYELNSREPLKERGRRTEKKKKRKKEEEEAAVASRHHPYFVVVFFLFSSFFWVQIQWKVGNREKWSDHGSQNREVRPQFAQVPAFSHRTVLEAKRTAKINRSRFFQSDRTIRFGFQNLGQNQDPT